MFQVIPAILENNWEEIERKIEIVRPFAKTVSIDVIDGKFAPNTTFLDPAPFKKYADELFLEVHLMTEEPVQYLKPFADAGFKRFVGQVEKMSDQIEFVAQGELFGEVGLALDGKTPLDAIKVPYENLDLILIMTINAGFSGQKFMPELLEKVKEIRRKNIIDAEGKPMPIEVDGGINIDTILLAKDAGATLFSANSSIFSTQNPEEAYKNLSNKVLG